MNLKELQIDKYYLRRGVVFKMDSHELLKVLDVGGTHNYEPIIIDEVWLVALGFGFSEVKLGARVFYNIGNFIVEICNSGCAIYYTHQKELICFVKYIHQLQILFLALTEQELHLKRLI